METWRSTFEELKTNAQAARAMNWISYSANKSKEAFLNIDAQVMKDSALEKTKDSLLLLKNLGDSSRDMLNKLDEALPPELQRDKVWQWIQVSVPFQAKTVSLLLLCCVMSRVLLPPFFRCCRMLLRPISAALGLLWKSFRMLGLRVARTAVKMMKAPGRKGCVMPRHIFEANPRAYFRGLRGK